MEELRPDKRIYEIFEKLQDTETGALNPVFEAYYEKPTLGKTKDDSKNKLLRSTLLILLSKMK